jgi:outer membrane protein TolC
MDESRMRISNLSCRQKSPETTPVLPTLFLFSFVVTCVLSFPLLSHAQDEAQLELFTLSDCIGIAQASSPDILAAQQRIEQARAAVEQARSGFYPRLSVRETFIRSDFGPLVFSNKLAQANLSGDFPMPPPPGFDPFAQFNDPGPYNNWNTQVMLQWPLFQGGRTYYGNRAALAQVDAAESALKSLHNNLAFSVSAAYYEILKSENSIGIAEQSVRQIQSHLDAAKARHENDVALRSDVLRVTVHLAESEEALEVARHNLERAKSQLNLVMGRPVSARLLLTYNGPPLESTAEISEMLEELTKEAHERRPELQAMNRTLVALEESVKAARASYYPQINAFAHYDIDSEDFSDTHDSWTVGVGANLSIFDGFLTRSNLRAARAKLHEAEAQAHLLRLRIEMDVKNAYLAKSEAARRLEVLGKTVAQAEETMRIVSERYAEGLVLVTDLIDAEAALTNVQLHLLSAHFDYRVASAALDRAVGRNVGEGTAK